MWSLLAAAIAALARLLGFSKYKAGRTQGRTEVQLDQAKQEAQVRAVQAQAAADAGVPASPGALADELRRQGRF